MIRLAERTQAVAPSAVREILKVAERPEVLSFAGGLPAPELFPIEAIAEAHARVLARTGRAALQYSTSEGYGPLREWVASSFVQRGVPTTADDVLITHGSQQGIDLTARVLLDPEAVVVTENPTYLAALQVFRASQAEVIGVDCDHEGMRLEQLAQVLATRAVRLIYVVPTFSNPTGVCWSAARRAGLMALAQAWNVAVLEDDPYSALRFEGVTEAPLVSLDSSRVISLGTFSKTLAPGLRLGWLRAPEAIRRHLVVARQANDLHPGTLVQRAVVELLSFFDLEAHLELLRHTYRERSALMLDRVRAEFPVGTVANTPEGGLFLWAELPARYDTSAWLAKAVTEQRVAFVPGAPFFVALPKPQTLRLNFSNCQPASIREGITRLGRLFAMETEVTSKRVGPDRLSG